MDKNGKQPYVPFMVVEPDAYDQCNRGLTLERILCAFQNVLMIPRGVIRTPFRKVLRDTVMKEYPRFRMSPARAVLEGRIPGIPKPVDYIHPTWKKRIQHALYLLDLLETLVYLHVEEEISRRKTLVRREADTIRKTFGGTKLPRLMEAVYELEEKEKTVGKPKTKPSKKRRKTS